MKSHVQIASFLALVSTLMFTACASEKKLEVLATTIERPRPPMPLECHSDTLEKFKPMKKSVGDKSTAEAALQALQSNKRRMSTNEDRAGVCECWVASEVKNETDVSRLSERCQLKPEPPKEAVKPEAKTT